MVVFVAVVVIAAPIIGVGGGVGGGVDGGVGGGIDGGVGGGVGVGGVVVCGC